MRLSTGGWIAMQEGGPENCEVVRDVVYQLLHGRVGTSQGERQDAPGEPAQFRAGNMFTNKPCICLIN